MLDNLTMDTKLASLILTNDDGILRAKNFQIFAPEKRPVETKTYEKNELIIGMISRAFKKLNSWVQKHVLSQIVDCKRWSDLYFALTYMLKDGFYENMSSERVLLKCIFRAKKSTHIFQTLQNGIKEFLLAQEILSLTKEKALL